MCIIFSIIALNCVHWFIFISEIKLKLTLFHVPCEGTYIFIIKPMLGDGLIN
jgi:hypothetical protein